MFDYQVLARKYRPQLFSDVLGQEAVVTTLKNAIKHRRLAHAYLFSGSRGTGKTTLARLFAKALNCQDLSDEGEPCNKCASCLEISSGNSLEVIEIDGASNRGIDDIRQINENVGYSTGSGKFKIYIIDEVHMLTKEAFNALLKTLEEPPPQVKFFFATTEPHKVLPTILSRCQRYHLNRISTDKILSKLDGILKDLGVVAEDGVLETIARLAEGGMRDAESILDQVIAFSGNNIVRKTVDELFGLVARDVLFELDQAGEKGDLSYAFKLSDQLFAQGKDLLHFIDELIVHFRNILIAVLNSEGADLPMSDYYKDHYVSSAKIYNREQCVSIIEFLTDFQNKIKFMPAKQVALETALMYIIRSHKRLPVEILVQKLAELEADLVKAGQEHMLPESSNENGGVKDSGAEGGCSADAGRDESSGKIDIIKSSEAKEKKTQVKMAEDINSKHSSHEKIQLSAGISQSARNDTLVRFAAVELDGTIHSQ